MMQLKMSVEYLNGETVDVTTIPFDLVVFERHYDKATSALATESRIEWLMFLAYSALKRRDGVKESFDEWSLTVASVTTGEEAEVPPLARTRRAGSSSTSPTSGS